MVDVGDTSHDDEGQVVEEPANDGVDAGVVDLVNVELGKLPVPSLPAEDVPDGQKTKDTEPGSRAPIDEGVAEKEVLDDLVVPAAHPETNVQNGPLPPLRSQVILLIGIGHKGVVGGHHGNVLAELACVIEIQRPVFSLLPGARSP